MSSPSYLFLTAKSPEDHWRMWLEAPGDQPDEGGGTTDQEKDAEGSGTGDNQSGDNTETQGAGGDDNNNQDTASNQTPADGRGGNNVAPTPSTYADIVEKRRCVTLLQNTRLNALQVKELLYICQRDQVGDEKEVEEFQFRIIFGLFKRFSYYIFDRRY